MQINQRLNVKQSQSIVMTPQLRQAIKLLQFSNLELSNYIEEEIEKNPFLDNKKNQMDENTNVEVSNSSEENRENDSMWKEKINNNNSISYEDISSFEDRIASPKKSLRTHLMDQILLDIPKGEERKIAILFLDVIEPSGWINVNISDFSHKNNINQDIALAVLEKLQKLEPVGVFARNLGECLRIQLNEKNKLNDKLAIITKNLDCLARGEIKKLCKMTSLSEEKLSEHINTIKTLNPKPAEYYAEDSLSIDPPDVLITKAKKGWKVELNKSTMPSLIVHEDLADKVKNNNSKDTDKKYVTENINSARWLIRAIQQRNSTTMKVAIEILKQQSDFFKNGPGHLKPLVLRDVAKSISMHESTVSRVTRSKLIQTPWGLFQMKDFFSSAVGVASDDEAHAAKTVRTLLKNLISNEKDSKPYSDDKISQILKNEGVNVARRTVAKYREMLNIPSSAERKRLMRLNKVIQIKSN